MRTNLMQGAGSGVARAKQAPRKPGNPQRQQASRSLKVLVVDDDGLVLMGTSAMVEDLGHMPFEARSAQQALAIVAKEAIDIVLTDYTMPGMSGDELADKLRERNPQLPIIITTGHADIPTGSASALPHLTKPFTLEDLSQALVNSTLAG